MAEKEKPKTTDEPTESPESRDQHKAEQREIEWRHEAQGLNKDGTPKKGKES